MPLTPTAALRSVLRAVQYTRYADDLTFSDIDRLARRAQAFEAHVAAIALGAGFRVNHRKTRIMRAATRQRVTGIVVNCTPNLPREHYNRLKATLHNCLRHGPGTQCSSGMSEFKRHRAGHIAHLAGVHPVRRARLRRMFEQVPWYDCRTVHGISGAAKAGNCKVVASHETNRLSLSTHGDAHDHAHCAPPDAMGATVQGNVP